MKKMILIFLAIIFSANLCAQINNYPSKEMDNYYRKIWRGFCPFFIPKSTVTIFCFKPEYYEIKKSKLLYEPYSTERLLASYQNSLLERIDSNAYSMLGIESRIERIGNIATSQILKYEKRDSIEAFIYESSTYENIFWGEPGIWIGYSENNGKTWNYFYTGIVQKQPVYIKPYSQRSLIKDNGVLEIDACLLKQLTRFSHPGPGPKYKCVKDGIYVILDINIIAKDSDGDGLSDIVEDKFYTDKYNIDTNGNGIPDNNDPNPRVNYPRTEKSKIYEAILNNEIEWERGGYNGKKGKLIFKEDLVYVSDASQTVLIRTDDKDLMGIKRSKSRIIFMSREESKKDSKGYSTLLERRSLTPLFKVDGMKDTYKIGESFGTASRTLLIRKTDEGWTIEEISFAMS
jgi:hypothetical protein